MSKFTDISITFEVRSDSVVLVASNCGSEVARGEGRSVQEAVPGLISHFREMQEAAIEVLYASGLVRVADEPVAPTPHVEPS